MLPEDIAKVTKYRQNIYQIDIKLVQKLKINKFIWGKKIFIKKIL